MRTGLALAAVAALALGAAATGQALSQGTVAVAVDVDVTGNDARTVATVDNCARIDSSGTNELQIDVVLPDPGIPADLGIKGWQFDLMYDPAIVNVTAEDKDLLLAQAEGSSLFPVTNPPDSDGDYLSAAFDNGAAFQIEPEGVQEVGPGVIARITLSGVSKGSTDLTLANVILVDADNNPIPLGSVLGAAVSVDTACEPPPSPTPPPDAGSPTAPGAETPLPGTPGAGEPVETGALVAEGMDATETQLVMTDATPSSVGDFVQIGDEIMEITAIDGNTLTVKRCVKGTTCTPHDTDDPILLFEDETGGTPGAETQPDGAPETGVGAEETDGGGLSAGAWAGIGVGIAAAVLAASGAGWFALRRRKAASE